jgi:hypothetical protein
MYRHPLVDINNINVPGQRICSHFLEQIPRADGVNKSFVRVRLYYLYLPMDVCTFFLHIFNKKIWLQFTCNKLISTTAHESVKIISLYLTAHTSLSPIRRGFAPSFVNYKKGCTRLAVASDKVYQGDRLVWAVRYNDPTHWAIRTPGMR